MKTTMIELHTKFPNTLNSHYTKTHNGIYVSKRGKEMITAVSIDVGEQLPGLLIDYRIAVEVLLFMPDRRKRDLDNYLKSLFDSITRSGLWVDDSLIDQLIVRRGEFVKGGRCVVRITAAGGVLLNDNAKDLP